MIAWEKTRDQMLDLHGLICPQNVKLRVNGQLKDARSETQAFESIYLVRRGTLRCRLVGKGSMECMDWEQG